jgi:hypothetical protein
VRSRLRLPAAGPGRRRAARLVCAGVVLGLAGAVAGSVVANRTDGSTRSLAWRDLTHAVGPLGEFGRPTTHVFRRERYYVRYVSERLGTAIPAGFPQRMVVLVAAGPRSTPAYRLEVVRVAERENAVVVSLREHTPGVADSTPSRLTFPYRAISIPWSAKPVTIDWLGRP